ncbi:MAG: TldD/PmbA family protein [Candidatus Zixiibacteriota bacterium]|nr:MAG: TldD/PmbA family protein [candidate division Zixibacteria bacterium]
MKIDRREFLKSTAAISAGAALSPGILSLLSGSGCSPGARGDLDEDQVAAVLEKALSKGGDFSEVYIEEISSTSFKMSEGSFSTATVGISQGAGVRTADGPKNGYAYVNGFNFQETFDAAETSAYISSSGKAGGIADPAAKSSPGYVTVEMPVSDVAETTKMGLIQNAEQAARDFNPLVTQVDIEYYDHMKRRKIANSNGLRIENEIPLIWVVINVLAEKNGVRHRGRKRLSAHQGFEFLEEIDLNEAARIAAAEAVTMLEAKPAPSGKMPVVLHPGWGGVLMHEAVGHGLEGDAVFRGASIFTGKLGEKVASDLVTLVDDSSWPNARGTTDFDDEGTPGQRNILIEKGILKGYMHDLISAKLLNAAPTGNGRRESYRHIPIPRMTNTFLENGAAKREDVIADTKNGLFVKALSGGSVEPATGEFNFDVREAYLIENGKITTPVSGASLIGKGIDVLTNIDAVADDLELGVGICGKGQWVPVTSGQPTVRVVTGITVGGTA